VNLFQSFSQEELAMDNFIFVGSDLHDKNMLLRIALNKTPAVTRSVANDVAGVAAMITDLKRRARDAGGAQIVVAYEASGLGFGLRDVLVDAGIECHVLAPSRMIATPKQRCAKTDEKDAERILEVLRGHYLAANALPAVWVPDGQTRDDRELVRARLDAQEKCTQLKAQIVTLLKRNGVKKVLDVGGNWTKKYRQWLIRLRDVETPLKAGARQHLGSLLRQLEGLEQEVKTLDGLLAELIEQPRYAARAAKLQAIKAVGVLTSLVFLTEMGDLDRFKNRRQVGAYLGLVPSSFETGEANDRKGHITHQGPARVRFVLNQAVWNILRLDPREREVYDRIVAKNPKHKKIAVVALMRRLAVRLWHAGRSAAA
jgi:transposase